MASKSTAAPWSVKGVDRSTRDTARHGAQAAGMTVGAWIEQAIRSHQMLLSSQAAPSKPDPLREVMVAAQRAEVRSLEAGIERTETRSGDMVIPVALKVQELAHRLIEIEQARVSGRASPAPEPPPVPEPQPPSPEQDDFERFLQLETEPEPEREPVVARRPPAEDFPTPVPPPDDDFERFRVPEPEPEPTLVFTPESEIPPARPEPRSWTKPRPAPKRKSPFRRFVGSLLGATVALALGAGSAILVLDHGELIGLPPRLTDDVAAGLNRAVAESRRLARAGEEAVGDWIHDIRALFEDAPADPPPSTPAALDPPKAEAPKIEPPKLEPPRLEPPRAEVPASPSPPPPAAVPPPMPPAPSAVIQPAPTPPPVAGAPPPPSPPPPVAAAPSPPVTATAPAPPPSETPAPSSASSPTPNGSITPPLASASPAVASTPPQVSALPASTTPSTTPAPVAPPSVSAPPADAAESTQSFPTMEQPTEQPPPAREADSLERSARQGDVKSQYQLGVLAVQPEIGAPDYGKAAYWFREAAVQGNSSAQYNLGVLYEHGLGVGQDDVRALLWYHSAAEQGHARSQYNLGVFYAQGRGIPTDYGEAQRWFKRAADQGIAKAFYNLAILAEAGLGGPVNPTAGRAFMSRAALLGDPEARAALAKKPAPKPDAARGDPSKPSTEVIGAVQHMLTELGYDAGRIDGVLGDKTRVAIRKFQGDSGLPQTGVASEELLELLSVKLGPALTSSTTAATRQR